MDKTAPGFTAMVARLQTLNAEVTPHLSGGGVAKAAGNTLRWNPNDDLLQIGNFIYVDVASITKVDIQHL